jgi:hypothetical protein
MADNSKPQLGGLSGTTTIIGTLKLVKNYEYSPI